MTGRVVLVTRPEPGAGATARRLRAGGDEAVLAPALVVAPRPGALPAAGSVQAVLATSANALAALPREFHPRPLLAVGDATATAARAAGFHIVHSAGADAVALAELATRICVPDGQKLLLASGQGQGMALAAELRRRGFRVVRRCVYAAVPAADMPAPALAALAARRVTHALFFSAASARAFVSLMRGRQDMAAGVEALAIAPGTATALTVLPWRRIRVASHPNQDELLALLA